MSRTKTIYTPAFLEEKVGIFWFNKLRDETPWENEINRLGCDIETLDEELLGIITLALYKFSCQNSEILGLHLNYYKDGTHYAPNHSHSGMKQIIISFGGERTLRVGKKEFRMKNGDAILFGSSTHGVPEEPNAEPRISLVIFLSK